MGYPSPGYFADRAEVRYVIWFSPDDDPDDVRAEIEAHVHHASQMDPWLRKNPPEVIWRSSFWPASNVAPDSPVVESLLRCRAEVLGDRATTNAAGAFEAGSDASYIERAGIPCVVFGPGSLRNAHAIDEHVDIEEIRDAARILVRTMIEWCGIA